MLDFPKLNKSLCFLLVRSVNCSEFIQGEMMTSLGPFLFKTGKNEILTFIPSYTWPWQILYTLYCKCVLVCSLCGLPGGSAGKESACNEGDLGSIAGLGRSPGEGKGYRQATNSSILAWRFHGVYSFPGIDHGVAKSWTQLSNFHWPTGCSLCICDPLPALCHTAVCSAAHSA